MPIKLQIRRGTATDWANATPSPTLASGEIGLETDTGNLKIGTGALTWANLDYLASTLPQVSAAGNDFDAAAYRVQGRYEISTSVTTNPPSGWTPASDAPAILSVFRTANGHLVQVLTSVTTQKSFVRGYNGSAYTTWTPLANFTDSVNTASIVDLAVTTGKINDLAVTTAKINDLAVTDVKIAADAVTTAKILDDAVTADKLRDDASTDANRAVTTNHIRDGAVTTVKLASDVAYNLVEVRYTSGTNTFTMPTGVYQLAVFVCGGGAGAKINTGTQTSLNLGGFPAAHYAVYSVTSATWGTGYTAVVGAGGNTHTSAHTAGGASSFAGISCAGGATTATTDVAPTHGAITTSAAPTNWTRLYEASNMCPFGYPIFGYVANVANSSANQTALQWSFTTNPETYHAGLFGSNLIDIDDTLTTRGGFVVRRPAGIGAAGSYFNASGAIAVGAGMGGAVIIRYIIKA